MQMTGTKMMGATQVFFTSFGSTSFLFSFFKKMDYLEALSIHRQEPRTARAHKRASICKDPFTSACRTFSFHNSIPCQLLLLLAAHSTRLSSLSKCQPQHDTIWAGSYYF